MGSLFLIRHGQASFGAANYDQLSERGIAQSRALGANTPLMELTHLDAVYSGPLLRQRDTLRLISEMDPRLPEPGEPLSAFAEYPAIELLRAFRSRLIAEEPRFAPLALESPDLGLLQRAMWPLLRRWARAEWHEEGLETMAQFTERVRGGISELVERHPSGRVAVATSGGPIGVAVLAAMGLSGEGAISLGLQVKNASVTEFRYRSSNFDWAPHDLSLVGFNHVGHLMPDQRTLI